MVGWGGGVCCGFVGSEGISRGVMPKRKTRTTQQRHGSTRPLCRFQSRGQKTGSSVTADTCPESKSWSTQGGTFARFQWDRFLILRATSRFTHIELTDCFCAFETSVTNVIASDMGESGQRWSTSKVGRETLLSLLALRELSHIRVGNKMPPCLAIP